MSAQSTPAPILYKDIPGFLGYRVGSDGSVWSCRRLFGNKGRSGWHRLKTATHDKGYQWLAIRRVPGGKPVLCYVHSLVLTAFNGPCPPGLECLHGDGNPGNNALSNLRWGTTAENSADMMRHGRGPNVLNELIVRVIDRLLAAGLRPSEVALLFGVDASNIRLIRRRKTWKHVPMAE